jgi:hypothetical protein
VPSVIVCCRWFRQTPVVQVWFRAGVVRACGQPASVIRQPAQPAVPADRFAREIVRFLARCVMRLRLLNGNPLGARHQSLYQLSDHYCQ